MDLLNRYLWVSDKYIILQAQAIVPRLVDKASHKYILHELSVIKMENFTSQGWPEVGLIIVNCGFLF